MAAAVNQKSSVVVHAVALPAALEQIAAQVAGALQETASLSETLGDLTREAGKHVKKNPETLDPFVDACRQLCASVGLTEGSFKVYLSNIRGVLRAMVEGYAPKAGQSLRSMYDAAPKGTGRQKAKGARHATDKAESNDDADVASVPVSKDDAKRAAITALFGHCDDELIAALDWASRNEQSFIRYVKANLSAASKPAVAPLKKAA
jgi:hypothetical protein